jgi:hypothetical protein
LSNIFRVQTAHGTVLAFDLVKGRIVHRRVSEVGTDYPTALLYIPEQSPSLAFLLADNPNAIPVAPSYEQAHGPILTLKRHRLPPFATYAFRHSHRQEYLLTRPELEVDGSGIVAFYAIEPASWEECHLIGSADLDKAGSVQTQIAQIQLAYDAMPDGILSLLRQTPTGERRQLAYLLGSMLDSAGAERLGAKLLSEPALNVEVAGWLPDDPWVNTALPDLREFLRKRDGRPPAAEPLAVSNSTAQQTQLGSLLCGGTPALQTFEAHPACVDAHVKRSIGIHFDRIASAGFFGEYASIMQRVMLRPGDRSRQLKISASLQLRATRDCTSSNGSLTTSPSVWIMCLFIRMVMRTALAPCCRCSPKLARLPLLRALSRLEDRLRAKRMPMH